MIQHQILSAREKLLALIASVLLIALVVVGYSRTAGSNLQAASVSYDMEHATTNAVEAVHHVAGK